MTGILAIEGAGKTTDDYKTVGQGLGSTAPWNDYRGSIKNIDLTGAPNLIEIGDNAFKDCTSLTTVTMPNVVYIYHGVFY
ncbi:MAG: hypothetical protein RR063_12745, partial [Anaerovoracaceae bacterium]